MTVGIRPKGSNDGFYSPQRDLLYLFPSLLRKTMYNFEDDQLEEKEWLEKLGLWDQRFADAAAGMARYIRHSCDGSWTFEAVLDLVKWNEVPFEIRAAIGYRMLMMLMGSFYAMGKEATVDGVAPFDVDDLTDAMVKLSIKMRRNRFARKLKSYWTRITGFFGNVAGLFRRREEKPDLLNPQIPEEEDVDDEDNGRD